MEQWKIDVPVLLIFFNRPNEFRQVFESVRAAKPSTLLLWQDGPRAGREDDILNIQQCRKIAEQIDWDCHVYRNYHSENMGCDPSTFLAHKWAFSLVDKCIIMEDDRIPDQTFYLYCKELLDYYENDTRISHICGTNLLEEHTSCDSDYFFASHGSTTWASWKRVADQWEEQYDFLNNQYAMDCLRANCSKSNYKHLINTARRHAASGKQYWETILGMSCILNHQVAIIPKRNLICDIGLTTNSTHALAESKCLPKNQRKMFNMKTYSMSFPMTHPQYIQIDRMYENELNKFSGEGYPFLKMRYTFHRIVMYIYYGEFQRLFDAVIDRIKKLQLGGKH